MTDELIHQRHSAFEPQSWGDMYARLAAADATGSVATPDLELLATAAYLTGRDEASVALWTRVYDDHVRASDVRRAARAVFWLALNLLNRKEQAHASGWLARARRLLEEGGHDCPELGLLCVLEARLRGEQGDFRLASTTADAAAALGARFDDPELKAFSRLIVAQMRVRAGDPSSAATLFDEIMVVVTTSPVSPITVGTMYCAVIEACQAICDVGRAREWTKALSRWCATQAGLVPVRGICLVHRAEILCLGGAWSEAVAEAEQVCDWEEPPAYMVGPVASALYQIGEIHRMRGNVDQAEGAYRRAAETGRMPEPGLSLLRLAQGRSQAAASSLRRALDESRDVSLRAPVLAAHTEILIALGDLDTARVAATELAALAGKIGAPYLRALSTEAEGRVMLAAGAASAALSALREAWMTWQELEAPYQAARVRVLRGLACRALGDHDGAELELKAAVRVFRRLGAAPDERRAFELLAMAKDDSTQRLTERELQVIRLVADGKTNRAIATDLAISERTVDRHVANILRKLGLPSRAAATAYAFQHHLLQVRSPNR